MAATTGFEDSSMRSRISCSPGSCGGLTNSVVSAPAMNVAPATAMTIALTAPSPDATTTPSLRPWRTLWLSTWLGGLLMVITATWPRRSRSTNSVMAVMVGSSVSGNYRRHSGFRRNDRREHRARSVEPQEACDIIPQDVVLGLLREPLSVEDRCRGVVIPLELGVREIGAEEERCTPDRLHQLFKVFGGLYRRQAMLRDQLAGPRCRAGALGFNLEGAVGTVHGIGQPGGPCLEEAEAQVGELVQHAAQGQRGAGHNVLQPEAQVGTDVQTTHALHAEHGIPGLVVDAGPAPTALRGVVHEHRDVQLV